MNYVFFLTIRFSKILDIFSLLQTQKQNRNLLLTHYQNIKKQIRKQSISSQLLYLLGGRNIRYFFTRLEKPIPFPYLSSQELLSYPLNVPILTKNIWNYYTIFIPYLFKKEFGPYHYQTKDLLIISERYSNTWFIENLKDNWYGYLIDSGVITQLGIDFLKKFDFVTNNLL